MSLRTLTDLSIQKLAIPSSGQRVHYEASGLGIRVSQGGTKSFVVQVGKKRQRKTIGRYPNVSLKEARAKALKIINDFDPNYINRPAKEVIEIFIEFCSVRLKPSTYREYNRVLTKYFPNCEIQAADRQLLLTTLGRLSNRPGGLFRITVVFQTFLNWCVNNGFILYNPIAGIKNQGRIRSRERILDDEELKSVWLSLPKDRFGTYVKLMILTGQRRGEIPNIEINRNIAYLDKKHTKNGRSHSFPVGNFTISNFTSVEWNGWSKSKRHLDRASGVTDWTYHDLRRTFASNHARLGTPIHVIEKMLNHVSGTISGIAAVYNRYSYMDEMREACLKYETWLSELVSSDA